MVRSLEQTTMRKVYLRILPFAALTYFMCYLDRINVGFAALTMNKDIGLDAAIYGMAAGAFFWGYVLAEVPSNIILEKVGARLWIARIMITWGIISGLHRLRAPGRTASWPIRFLLGLAEAGSVPRLRALLHLLVPGRLPRPHQFRVHAGPADRGGDRRAGFDRAARPRRAVGSARLAGDVHPRSDPDRADRRRRVLLPDRHAGQGALARPTSSAHGWPIAWSASAGRSRRRTGSACCARSGTRRSCCWR